MTAAPANSPLRLFTTCPRWEQSSPDGYLRHVQRVARWSEDAGCEGILVFTDNRQVDPWLASHAIITATRRLCPLVAVQPLYMHPYSAAKMITSLALLHGRRVHLNMVAGGFKNDLEALSDHTPHDERYARLAEYTIIVQQLLQSAEPYSFSGRYYQVRNVRLSPPMPRELRPEVLLSGSSDAGLATARRLAATPVEYPKPFGEYTAAPRGETAPAARGIRIGIIARASDRDAWRVAYARFPEDRRGQLTHELAMKSSDSCWHRQLSEHAAAAAQARSPYWLTPFKNYRTFCPYLVGSYARLADAVACYVSAGYRTFILDVPPDAAEMRHTGTVFELAAGAVAA